MKKTIFALLFALSIIGCKKSETKTPAQFQGTWKGYYTGGDKGSLLVDVDASGNLKGVSVSSKTLEAFGMTGKVDANGVFNGTSESGTLFTGNFTTSTADGSWNNTALRLSGTWTGTKQ